MGNKNKRITPRFRIETSIDPELASLKQINKDFWELKTVLPDGTKATIKDKVLNSGEGWVEFAMGHNPTTFAKMEDAGLGYIVSDIKPANNGVASSIVKEFPDAAKVIRAAHHIPDGFEDEEETSFTVVKETKKVYDIRKPEPEVVETIKVVEETKKVEKVIDVEIEIPTLSFPVKPKPATTEIKNTGSSLGSKIVKVVAIGAATGWLLYRTVKFIMDDEV